MPPEHAKSLGYDAPPRPRSMEEASAQETWICRNCGRAARRLRPAACPVCGGEDFQAIDKDSVARQAASEGGSQDETSFDGFRVRWTAEGKRVLEAVPKGYERRRVKARIEKLARTRRLPAITAQFAEENLEDAHAPVAAVVGDGPGPDAPAEPPAGAASSAASGWVATPRHKGEEPLRWTDEASARLDHVPAGFMRSLARTKVEEFARRIQAPVVDAEVAEGGLVDARDMMGQMLRAYGPGAAGMASAVPGHGGVPTAPGVSHPAPGWTEDGVRRLNEVEVRAAEKFDPARAGELARHAAESRASRRSEAINAEFLERLGLKLGYGHPLSDKTYQHHFTWTPEAEEKLKEVPAFCRELTRWRVEWTAFKKGLGDVITPEAMDLKYELWGEVSQEIAKRGPSLAWDDDAGRRLARVPEFVRGQVIQAVEGNARGMGEDRVTGAVLDRVIDRWIATGDFHEGRFGFRA